MKHGVRAGNHRVARFVIVGVAYPDADAPAARKGHDIDVPHDLVALEGSPHTPVNRFAEYAPLLVRYLNLYMKD